MGGGVNSGLKWLPAAVVCQELSRMLISRLVVWKQSRATALVIAASLILFGWSGIAAGADSERPTITITVPTSSSTFTTKTSPLALGGTASDNVGVTLVTWRNSRGGSGTATGTTSWSVSGIALQAGTNDLTVTARDAAGNTRKDTLKVTYDPTSPTVTITSPTSASSFSTGTNSMTLGGNAADNLGVTQVTWSNNRGGSGTASGTTNWSVSGIALQGGTNVLTVTARDAAGNTGTDSLTVNYTTSSDTTGPAVAITSPTTATTFATSTTPLTLAGTASDNVGVAQVTWSNSQGGSGTASGTTNWSASGIALQAGTNLLTVTARDAAGNTGTDTLTVTYTPPSPSAGLVAAYGFNEGAGTFSADVSGNGHTATLVNNPSWVAGQFGSALSFNGTSSYATTGLTTNLPNWTVSGWVRGQAAPAAAAPSGPINRQANYQINWNHDNPLFQGTAAMRIGTTWHIASFGPLAGNTWYYLAATYDGETLRAYTNGQLITSNPTPSGPPAAEPAALTIGRHATVNNFFQGSVDNVRIYNRALSQTEIQSDMTTPLGPPPPDTTPPTVTIISPVAGATVSGNITVTAEASDNVFVAGVQFRLDGAPLGVEDTTPTYSTSWDTYSTSWNTSTATDGSHVLSAVARDTAGNQTTSVINVHVSNGGASGSSVVGQWSAPFSLPVKDVHMVLFRTGDVLMWDAFGLGQMAYLWNSSTGVLTYVPSSDNIFCAGPVLMADGSVLVAGGHVTGGIGIRDVNRFDPITRTWSALAPMAFPRWYPTTTTLPDGRVLVVSGSTNCITCIADIPELYNPTTNTWTQLSGARLNMPLYPHMYVLPDGRVLYASASEGTIQTRALNVATQTWTMIDPVAVDGGSSAMYLPGVILKAGSPGAPGRLPVATSLSTAYVLDMTQPTPGWQQVGSMAFGRTFHSLTLLPDGNVLATGGSATNDPASQPVYAAEIWNPQTETWSLMSSMQMARTYHETALLLPDGRVLVGGGGGCCGAPNQFNAEIFSPPYLFKGSRPAITSIETPIAYGAQFFVGTPDWASIASVALIRLGSDTHQFNRDQRYLPLSFTVAGNGLDVTMPANRNLAPPGDYMLFLVKGNGVPSVASIVTVH
jgi:Galactose oxidase-like, Early set domain/Concanavalin A-like lectin/glucanases superfamily/Bacterial Ig domain/Bacterial Ig-like domain/Kelch motif/Galactose oxidase, central domain